MAHSPDDPFAVTDAFNGRDARAVDLAAGYPMPQPGANVVDIQGVCASVVTVRPGQQPSASPDSPDSADSADSGNAADLVVLTAAGHEVRLPRNLLQRESDLVFRVPFAFTSLIDASAQTGQVHLVPAAVQVIPVMQEALQVDTRLVDTGRGVRIHKSVEETPQVVTQTLAQDRMTVERIACDRLIEDGQTPAARYEGQTLVIPVLEEVLVLRKQLRIKEEIRVTRVQKSVETSQTVMLRTEQVQVERFDDNRGEQG